VKKGDEVNYLYLFMAQALCLFPSVSVNELTAFTVLQEALPVAQKLGEKVLETCATKVKPYLIQAVKSLGVSLDDYSDIVGSMCQEISGSIEQKDVHAGDENKVSLLCC
jgi:hypothetical protein